MVIIMKKRLLSILLTLCMVLALLPVTVQAAEPDLPDWYFLFAIFKNVDADCGDNNNVVNVEDQILSELGKR